jgi:hypothetical protein
VQGLSHGRSGCRQRHRSQSLGGCRRRDRRGRGGFAFSDALKAKGGKWDFALLDEWLTNPKKFADGTKMTFAGLSSPEDRANVILYLNSKGSNLPLPAPEAAGAAPDAAASGAAPDAAASDAAACQVRRPVSFRHEKGGAPDRAPLFRGSGYGNFPSPRREIAKADAELADAYSAFSLTRISLPGLK